MRTVIVPLDGSILSESALRPAIAVARRTGGGVVLVRVAEPADTPTALTYLRERSAPFADVCPIETVVVPGRPGQSILAVAEERTDAVVCMATHGHGGLSRLVLGAVAEEVVTSAGRPVLLVGPQCRTVLLPGERARLVVCSDGSPAAASVVPAASQLALALDLATWVVEVVGPEEAVALDDGVVPDAVTDAATARLEGLCDRFARAGVAAQVQVLHGAEPAGTIADYCRWLPASFLAVATHGRTGLRRVVMGSVAAQLVRSAPCPVLMVRAGG